jgi:hypothetical protein
MPRPWHGPALLAKLGPRAAIPPALLENGLMTTDPIDKASSGAPETKMPGGAVPLPVPPAPPRRLPGETSLKVRRSIDRAVDAVRAAARWMRPPIPWVSQCGQDRFVAEKIFRRKRDGSFLEIGGGDGLYLSNTLILESYFGWTGILVEPTGAFDALVRNRPKATCVHAAVAGTRKTLRLTEIVDKGQIRVHPKEAGGNRLLSVTEDADAPSTVEVPFYGAVQNSYLVEAITLDELLTNAKAPATIDYFSFDVEGSEYDILKAFPFGKWKFNCIGVETPSIELDRLLAANGYLMIREGAPLDWFYLHRDFLDEWYEGMR